MKLADPSHRPYRQTARAEAAEDTARRIAESFAECIHAKWLEDVTLEEVGRRAGVTVRTILRRFGSKEGLLAGFLDYVAPEIRAERTVAPGDVDRALDRVIKLYERLGDGALRTLSQETRHSAIKPLLDRGRAEHREITEVNFAPWLDRLSSTERRRAVDALVIATDVYTWKLLRRDMGRSITETKAVMLALIEGALVSSSTSPSKR